jgi:hypothetical protein
VEAGDIVITGGCRGWSEKVGVFSQLDGLLGWNMRLLEWSPFEVLLIPSACNGSLRALLAGGFRLIALQTFIFARNATITTLGLFPLGYARGLRRFRCISGCWRWRSDLLDVCGALRSRVRCI